MKPTLKLRLFSFILFFIVLYGGVYMWGIISQPKQQKSTYIKPPHIVDVVPTYPTDKPKCITYKYFIA